MIAADFEEAFTDFLREQDIDPNVYRSYQDRSAVPCRFFTLNPLLKDETPIEEVTCEMLQEDLKTDVYPVSFLPHFYRVDGSTSMTSSRLYQSGKLFCMDLSSALAVYALDIQPTDHILDLCCAPGAKLGLISMLLQTPLQLHEGGGTVTGVDISPHRLSTCRSLIKKYRLYRCRLYLHDGCTFKSGSLDLHDLFLKRQQNATTLDLNLDPCQPFYAPKFLQRVPSSARLYDKVLVDAECTHDGSIAHILKYKHQWRGGSLHPDKFLDKQRLTTLKDLQRGLLRNGWRLLSPGGVLVYSTCSFSRHQNEDVVAWFLLQQQQQEDEEEEGDAELEEIPLKWPRKSETSQWQNEQDIVSPPIVEGERKEKDMKKSQCQEELEVAFGRERVLNVYARITQCCQRLHGHYEEGLWTSGLFIARFRKKSTKRKNTR